MSHQGEIFYIPGIFIGYPEMFLGYSKVPHTLHIPIIVLKEVQENFETSGKIVS